MTEAQAQELIEMVKEYNFINKWSSILIAVCTILWIGMIIWEIYRLQKIKKWKNEYKATLTEEQRKALKEFKEITK